MYSNHMLETSRGRSTAYPSSHAGAVQNSGGDVLELSPNLTCRRARRVLVHTSQIERDESGVYRARIERAQYVMGVRLAYASVPRLMRSHVVQLVLTSIPIRTRGALVDSMYQRLERNNLLSDDTSDVPFFSPASSDFDFRNLGAPGIWTTTDGTGDATIPIGAQSTYANHLLTVDTLTVRLPTDVTIRELGEAFRGALSVQDTLRHYAIEPTDSGFQVELSSLAAVSTYSTFANVHLAALSASRTQSTGLRSTARQTVLPLKPPVVITLDVAKAAYVETVASSTSGNAVGVSAGVVTPLTKFRPVEALASGISTYDGVVFHYRQRTSPVTLGTWRDLSGNGNHATLTGTYTNAPEYFSTLGGNVNIRTGVNWRDDLGYAGTSGELTLGLYFQYTGAEDTSYQPLFAPGGGSKYTLAKSDADNLALVHLWLFSAPFVSDVGIFDAVGKLTAHTVILTYVTLTTLRLYVDGVFVGSFSSGLPNPPSEELCIGGHVFYSWWLDANIYEAFGLSRVVTPLEAYNLHKLMLSTSTLDTTYTVTIPATVGAIQYITFDGDVDEENILAVQGSALLRGSTIADALDGHPDTYPVHWVQEDGTPLYVGMDVTAYPRYDLAALGDYLVSSEATGLAAGDEVFIESGPPPLAAGTRYFVHTVRSSTTFSLSTSTPIGSTTGTAFSITATSVANGVGTLTGSGGDLSANDTVVVSGTGIDGTYIVGSVTPTEVTILDPIVTGSGDATGLSGTATRHETAMVDLESSGADAGKLTVETVLTLTANPGAQSFDTHLTFESTPRALPVGTELNVELPDPDYAILSKAEAADIFFPERLTSIANSGASVNEVTQTDAANRVVLEEDALHFTSSDTETWNSLDGSLALGDLSIGTQPCTFAAWLRPTSYFSKQSSGQTAVFANTYASSGHLALFLHYEEVNVWTAAQAINGNGWSSVCWAAELGIFCATSTDGTGNRVKTSPDGITWTLRTSAADNLWECVCWSPQLSLFCVVGRTGVGNRVMTSPDGITWTTRASAADENWRFVCWSPQLTLFCAVGYSGASRVMTSPDGINWTLRTTNESNNWVGVCWSAELTLFCAVADAGGPNRVMTSPDGINWTTYFTGFDGWFSVCWSAELTLFCAVSIQGNVLTSPDGTTWTSRAGAASNQWRSICWAPELYLFCAVSSSGSGDRVMTSPDGVNWTTRPTDDRVWRSVCWAPELSMFASVAVGYVMTAVVTAVDGGIYLQIGDTDYAFSTPEIGYNLKGSAFKGGSPLDRWTHIAMTRDSLGLYKLYIDGTLNNIINIGSNENLTQTPYYLGGQVGDGQAYDHENEYVGYAKDVVIDAGVEWTEDELRSLYSARSDGLVTLRRVKQAHDRKNEVRLDLRWPGYVEGVDYVIEPEYRYESPLLQSGNRRDVAQMSQYAASPSYVEHNNLATICELRDTFIPADGVMAQVLPVSTLHTSHESDEMLFCGHFMNVEEPTLLPTTDVAASDNAFPNPTDDTIAPSARYRRPADVTDFSHFYARGLGWQARMTQVASKYIMPAYPLRSSVGKYPLASGFAQASVSPLVARILNGDQSGVPFYKPVIQGSSTDLTDAILADLADSASLGSAFVFVPREMRGGLYTNAIVVTLGSARYVVRSARFLSVLANGTNYTLDIQQEPGEVTILRPVHTVDQDVASTVVSAHAFYTHSVAPSFAATDDAKYWAWVFELDRKVSTGLPLASNAEPVRDNSIPPPLATREYGGLHTSTALFVPSAYYRDTGRQAARARQSVGQRWHVRQIGAQLRGRPMLRMEDFESQLEGAEGGGFALFHGDTDVRTEWRATADNCVWFGNNARDIESIQFRFADALTGAAYDDNQDSTLVFDLYGAS